MDYIYYMIQTNKAEIEKVVSHLEKSMPYFRKIEWKWDNKTFRVLYQVTKIKIFIVYELFIIIIYTF